ncbi:MAG TPA: DUF3617 family protein [Allosphingosinicella sp.]|jgi:hypothetical protein|nr:DUF3617 family protein [Allosphingosinicella sp.]
MTRYKHLLSGAALAALGMLGGCGGGGNGNGAGGGNVVVMEPGEWETTFQITNIQTENLPPEMRDQANQAQGRSQTVRNCLAGSADVIRIQNLRFTVPVPMAGPGPAPGCRMPELSMESGRIRLQMSCEGMPGPMMGGGTMSMSAEMNGTYTANSVEATGRGEVRMSGGRGSAEMRMTGRRLGACPAPRPYIPPPVPQPMPDMNTMDTMPPDMGNMATNAM